MIRSSEVVPNDRKSLRISFQDEYSRRISPQGHSSAIKQHAPITDEDYIDECSVIPAALLQKPSDHERDSLMPGLDSLPRNLEAQFGRGDTFCLAVIPFDDGCLGEESKKIDGTWDSFLKGHAFMRFLVKSSKDGLTRGFGGMAGNFYELLCRKLKEDVEKGGCSFVIEYPFPDGDSRNKTWFYNKFAKVLENLRDFLNGL